MEFLDKLLEYYSLTKEEYFKMTCPVEQIKLIDPNSILGMDKIKERIFSAINNNEKIVVYGDYDCDGISATTIMVKTFQKLNYNVSHYIPSRYIDNYGLNVANVEKLHKNGFKLIICVDNGISQHEAIFLAKSYGIDVIVVDHHEVPEKPVEAYAILHPTVSKINEVIASGGYVSLFLSAALLGYYDHYLVTIAGLSVISDLMELKSYNRDVVRLALYYLEKEQFRPLMLLLDNKIITEKSFGMDIAPKLNAIGRIIETTNVNLTVKFLTTDDDDEVLKLADWIIRVNNERKEITKAVSDEINDDFANAKGICLYLNVKEGLAGLIANRLMTEYKVPTIIFTKGSDGSLKGSVRSKEGFNVVKAIESLKKYLLTGGGHALAGGLSIKEEDFDEFKKHFVSLCEEYPITEPEKPKLVISLSDITFENYNTYRSLAPFGMGFPEPVLTIQRIPTRGLQFNSFGKNLSTPLSIKTKLFGFNISEKEIKAAQFADFYGEFFMSEFRGAKTLELRVNDYKTYC